jgi:D-amino peptidase
VKNPIKPIKNLYISADLEGVAGVTHPSQVFPKPTDSLAPYQQAVNQLATEVGWVIDALATNATVNDSHAHMTNLFRAGVLDCAEAGVSLISGKPKPYGMMAGLFEGNFDAVALIGYHAKANSLKAVLCHSFNDAVANIQLNGVSLGEAGFSLLFAEIGCGVPVVLASGDDALASELKALKPSLITVTTKEAIGWSCANCFSVAKVQASYVEAYSQLQGNLTTKIVLPTWLTANKPWSISFSVQTPLLADIVALLPNATRTDGLTVRWEVPALPSIAEQMRWAYQSIQCAYSLLGYANTL